MPQGPVPQIEVPSLAEKAFHILESAVWRGELKPGDRLYDHRLAAELGISRSPVREALKRLEHCGLIRVVARRGTYVAQLTAEEVADLMEVREALEGLAARRAACRMASEAVQEMRGELEAIRRRAQEVGLSEYPREGRDFHQWVVEGAGSPRLSALMRGIAGQVRLIRFRSGADPVRAVAALSEHEQILEGIAQRDADLAEARMRSHIRAARDHILTVWPSGTAP